MRFALTSILLPCAISAAGCATHAPHPATHTPTSLPSATTRPTDRTMTLDQILPVPALREPAPSRVKNPPLDAIDLFARARAAMDDGERFAAIQLMEKAIELDPDSYELYFTLGELNAAPGMPSDRAVEAFEKAARVRPDDLAAHLELGRLYLVRKNLPLAIEHLRLARQTRDFSRDEDQAALVELFLAQALTEKGYLRAAADQYQSLLDRLTRFASAMRSDPEVSYLVARPDIIQIQLGELFMALDQPERAARAYEAAIQTRGDGDMDLQGRYLRALARTPRADEARRLAIALVSRFHARPDSLQVLEDVYDALGNQGAVADELAKLHHQRPEDRALLFALADVLQSQGQSARAEQVLVQAVQRTPGDLELVRRLFTVYDQQNRVREAASLLLESLGAEPDLLSDTTDLFAALFRPLRRGHLRIGDLQSLDLSPRAQGARWYWISQLANLWGRDELARSSMEKAVASTPPFAPAYRELLDRQWERPDWDDAQKIAASDKMIAAARVAGHEALADELQALSLVHQAKFEPAAKLLSALATRPRASFDVQVEYAQLLLLQSHDHRAEQMLWKLLSDFPTRKQPYQMLLGYYFKRGSLPQAMKVLTAWLSADPSSVDARLLNATMLARAGRGDVAMKILQELFQSHADDPQVLEAMHALYVRSGQLDAFVAELEAQRTKHPENRQAVEQLIRIYMSQSRVAEARRALEAMRVAAATDPDLLYSIASLYHAIGEQQGAESVLLDVLRLDPDYPPANNDLAYFWTESHRNLARAEQMVRTALSAEPDNQSYLDTLGWVQYKRGHFVEARQSFEKALGAAARPDPIILDHLADTLYRLNDKPRALSLWQRSLQRIVELQSDRDDLRALHLNLQNKLSQVEHQQPVSVAPVAEDAARSALDPSF